VSCLLYPLDHGYLLHKPINCLFHFFVLQLAKIMAKIMAKKLAKKLVKKMAKKLAKKLAKVNPLT
jgi:hypothetical protein